MRIVRLANFVTPRSGGLRTTLQALGEGYVEAGHDVALVVPGERYRDEQTPAGRVITLPGVRVPGTGGHRVLLGRRRLAALLAELKPNRIEVSDRFTLRWTGSWARQHGVPAIMVSHESLYGLFRVAGLPGPLARWATTRINRRTVRVYDAIVCTTAWASQDFDRSTTLRVPLGVDLATFHPDRHDTELRRRYADPDQVLIVHCGRLSSEKRPERSIEALAALRARGVDAVLVVAGDGPLRRRLVRRAAGLPVKFLAFVPDKAALAALLATADVAVAPGPIETFGLAALEALACGTPVVVDAASALPEVIGPEAGASVEGEGSAFAAGIEEVLSRPVTRRRQVARDRAEQFDWGTSVAGFLAIHAGETDPNRPVWMETPWAR